MQFKLKLARPANKLVKLYLTLYLRSLKLNKNKQYILKVNYLFIFVCFFYWFKRNVENPMIQICVSLFCQPQQSPKETTKFSDIFNCKVPRQSYRRLHRSQLLSVLHLSRRTFTFTFTLYKSLEAYVSFHPTS